MQLTLNRFEELGWGLIATLPAVLAGVLVYVAFWVLANMAKNVLLRVARRAGPSDHAALVYRRLARWGVLIFGVLVAATIIFASLDASTLLGTLGIWGVASGFAFRDSFTNLRSGLILLVTQPFRIGDQIVAGSAKGTVEDIQMRTTVLRASDNRRILVFNTEVFTGHVTVLAAATRTRSSFSFVSQHGADPRRVLGIVNALLPSLDGVLTDPAPNAIITSVSGDGVTFSVRYWVSPPRPREQELTTHEVVLAVTDKLCQEGIRLDAGTTISIRPPACQAGAQALNGDQISAQQKGGPQ